MAWNICVASGCCCQTTAALGRLRRGVDGDVWDEYIWTIFHTTITRLLTRLQKPKFSYGRAYGGNTFHSTQHTGINTAPVPTGLPSAQSHLSPSQTVPQIRHLPRSLRSVLPVPPSSFGWSRDRLLSVSKIPRASHFQHGSLQKYITMMVITVRQAKTMK